MTTCNVSYTSSFSTSVHRNQLAVAETVLARAWLPMLAMNQYCACSHPGGCRNRRLQTLHLTSNNTSHFCCEHVLASRDPSRTTNSAPSTLNPFAISSTVMISVFTMDFSHLSYNTLNVPCQHTCIEPPLNGFRDHKKKETYAHRKRKLSWQTCVQPCSNEHEIRPILANAPNTLGWVCFLQKQASSFFVPTTWKRFTFH